MTQGVRTDSLGDPGPSGDTPHDPPGRMTIEASADAVDEDRTLQSFTDGQVDGTSNAWREGHGDDLATLTHDGEGPVSPFQSEGIDVGADRFGHAQPIQRQQRHQRMVAWRRQSGGDQDRAEFVAVEMGEETSRGRDRTTRVTTRRNRIRRVGILGVASGSAERYAIAGSAPRAVCYPLVTKATTA